MVGGAEKLLANPIELHSDDDQNGDESSNAPALKPRFVCPPRCNHPKCPTDLPFPECPPKCPPKCPPPPKPWPPPKPPPPAAPPGGNAAAKLTRRLKHTRIVRTGKQRDRKAVRLGMAFHPKKTLPLFYSWRENADSPSQQKKVSTHGILAGRTPVVRGYSTSAHPV